MSAAGVFPNRPGRLTQILLFGQGYITFMPWADSGREDCWRFAFSCSTGTDTGGIPQWKIAASLDQSLCVALA